MAPQRNALATQLRGLRHAGLLSVCTALMGLTCHAEATPPDPTAVEAPIEVASVDPPDAAVGAPNEDVLALRRAALVEGHVTVVARADTLAAEARDRPEEAALFAWVAASLDPDPESARARFTRLAEGTSALSSWAALEAAHRSLDTDPARTRALLAPRLAPSEAGGLDPRWPGMGEARAIDALAAAATATPETRDAAEAALRAAAREELPISLDRTLSRALADLLATREGEPARREAIGLYLDLLAAAPRARASRGAEPALEALIASFPEEERALLRRPSLAQARQSASYLESTQQHRAASDAYVAVAARLDPGSVERCAALLDAGRALHRGRVNDAAIERLDAMIGECGPALDRAVTEGASERDLEQRRDALAWAHYALGRAAISSREVPRAILHLEAIEAVAPSHRLVDDGLVYAARARLERGERDQAHDAFTRAIAAGGDMRGEARFLLAWDLRETGHRDEALAELDRSVAEGTNESAEGIVGRAAYWRARLLSELGRNDDARDSLEAIVRARPLTYYAQLALARLGEIDPARRDAVRTAVIAQRTPLGASGPSASMLSASEAVRTVATRLATDADRATFQRAQALLSVDELGRAERELASLGLAADGDLATVSTLTALLTQAGHAHRATSLARQRLASVLISPSDAQALALFRTAYPPAYIGLIEDAAGLEDVDPSLVRAVAREESSFDPDAVSVAHAYGLLQLIRPTAQRYARPLGLESDPAALCTPSVNVRIGARYMGALRRRYDGHAAFIPAAYNAGEGNVDRWLRDRAEQPFDAWVEQIPFGETRGYTRRVLQSWIVYAFLDRGELPELPTITPRRG